MSNGATAATEPEPTSPSPTDELTDWRGAGVATTHSRIRDTARSIEERIRRVLLPPGSAIATLRFLVVDDVQDSADALAAVLELLGCQVRVCYDAPSAISAAGDFDPHVCLLDLRMPKMDGFDLARRLKTRVDGGPRLLIAITGLGDAPSREKSRVAGFHLHLLKPVDMPTLLEAITKLWEIVREQSGGQPGGSPNL